MLSIIYRDDDLIAIYKPPGLLVHRSDLDRHEQRFAVQLLRDQIGRRVFPVHRLDKGTSGVLLFAFTPETVRVLAKQFEAGLVSKSYIALVRGWPPESGKIDHPLSRKFDDYGRSLSNPIPQSALTHFKRLATVELATAVDKYPTSRYALVALQPITGRQHQLRRHMKHIGHPIIGDATHGKGIHNRFFTQAFGCNRLLLACTGMTLTHPKEDRSLYLGTSPGQDFTNLIDHFGWSASASILAPRQFHDGRIAGSASPCSSVDRATAS